MSVKPDGHYSVVIRTKNSAAVLESTLRSLLLQTLPPVEVVLVDNQSVDDTISIATRLIPEVKILEYPNGIFNYSKALNFGIENTRSPYIFLLSSHVELISSEVCEIALRYLIENQNYAGVTLRRNKERHSDETLLSPSVISLPALTASNHAHLISRKAWQVTHFREDVTACEDKFWEKDLAELGWDFGVIGDSVRYRNPNLNGKKIFRDQMISVRFFESGSLFRNNSKKQVIGFLGALRRGEWQLLELRIMGLLGRICGLIPFFKIPGSSYYP